VRTWPGGKTWGNEEKGRMGRGGFEIGTSENGKKLGERNCPLGGPRRGLLPGKRPNRDGKMRSREEKKERKWAK